VVIERPFHIIGVVRKSEVAVVGSVEGHNIAFMSESADWRRYDPLARLEQ
jgi:hypothetical protein